MLEGKLRGIVALPQFGLLEVRQSGLHFPVLTFRESGSPERPNDNRAIREERCVISTFRITESMGFKGDFRQWEELLRICD